MDSIITTIIVHFNGSITTIDESVIFMCDYLVLVYLLDIMLLDKLRVEFSQSINVGF